MSGRFIPSFENLDPTPTPSDAVDPVETNPFFNDEENNVPDDTAMYPGQSTDNPIDASAIITSLESIREDLEGTFQNTQTAIPVTEFVVDVELDDNSKAQLDEDIAEVVSQDPELLGSLESIHLCDERSVKTIIGILDTKIEELKK